MSRYVEVYRFGFDELQTAHELSTLQAATLRKCLFAVDQWSAVWYGYAHDLAAGMGVGLKRFLQDVTVLAEHGLVAVDDNFMYGTRYGRLELLCFDELARRQPPRRPRKAVPSDG